MDVVQVSGLLDDGANLLHVIKCLIINQIFSSANQQYDLLEVSCQPHLSLLTELPFDKTTAALGGLLIFPHWTQLYNVRPPRYVFTNRRYESIQSSNKHARLSAFGAVLN
jgi:hypothetical protein